MPVRPPAAPATRLVAVVVAVALAVGAIALARSLDRSAPRSSTTAGPGTPSQRVQPGTTLHPRPASACDTVTHGLPPEAITIAGVTRRASVITPPRDANGVPGVPPLTSAGKSVFAWDRAQGTRPGDAEGNVLLNAHTWPDGSALGNRLLAGLHVGDRVVVLTRKARLCYRVTERVEVAADARMLRYYSLHGRPQLAILACSGRRLGPGLWEKRTVWFASPVPLAG